MKVAILAEIGKIEYKDIKIPKIEEDEVLIKVMEIGICGSDLSTYKGTHPYKRPPIVLGHEVCGIVNKVGRAVKGLKKGDKVCAESYSACESCAYCKDDKPNLCSNKKNSGCDDWSGSFAEYFKAPQNCIYKLPKNVNFSEGVLVEPLAVAHHILNLSDSVKGKTIVIIGSGNIGLCSLICAKKLGAKEVLCTDIDDSKGSLAKKLGADYFVNVSKDNLVDSVKSNFKEGVNITLIAADYPRVVDEAIEITKPAGEIITVSYFEKNIDADYNQLVRKELTMKGSTLSCKEDFSTIIKWLENKEINVLPIISDKLPLEKAEEAMKLAGKNAGKILLYN